MFHSLILFHRIQSSLLVFGSTTLFTVDCILILVWKWVDDNLHTVTECTWLEFCVPQNFFRLGIGEFSKWGLFHKLDVQHRYFHTEYLSVWRFCPGLSDKLVSKSEEFSYTICVNHWICSMLGAVCESSRFSWFCH